MAGVRRVRKGHVGRNHETIGSDILATHGDVGPVRLCSRILDMRGSG